MWRRSRAVVGAIVVAALLVLAIPDALLWAGNALVEFVRGWILAIGQPIPQSVLLGIGIAALFVVSFLFILAAIRMFSDVGVAGGSRLSRWYDRLTPESPTTTALIVMLLLVVVLFAGFAAFVPWFGASLTEDTDIDDVVRDIKQGEYAGEVPGLFEDDTVRHGVGTDIAQKEPGADTDGDGLADSWERAGVTPWGATLADADPDRLDLYVQVYYGEDVSPLTDPERRQLRSVWEDMPVENPDGSTGITLHLVEEDLGEEVLITGSDDADRFYTEERLGERYCVDYQVTLGQIQDGETIGYAETPGHASILDGSQFEAYEGDVSFRVAMLTHALLHNVVGEVDGSVHSNGGWLDYPASENERLTDAVARQIESDGFVTAPTQRERCASVTNVTGS